MQVKYFILFHCDILYSTRILIPWQNSTTTGVETIILICILTSEINYKIIAILEYMTNHQIYGLMQERCNSIANALELHLSCTNPSKCKFWQIDKGTYRSYSVYCIIPENQHSFNSVSLISRQFTCPASWPKWLPCCHRILLYMNNSSGYWSTSSHFAMGTTTGNSVYSCHFGMIYQYDMK